MPNIHVNQLSPFIVIWLVKFDFLGACVFTVVNIVLDNLQHLLSLLSSLSFVDIVTAGTNPGYTTCKGNCRCYARIYSVRVSLLCLPLFLWQSQKARRAFCVSSFYSELLWHSFLNNILCIGFICLYSWKLHLQSLTRNFLSV